MEPYDYDRDRDYAQEFYVLVPNTPDYLYEAPDPTPPEGDNETPVGDLAWWWTGGDR